MRHTKIWKVEAKGRDHGKHFLITEMLASKGETWAYRALLALMSSGAQLPDDFASTGMAGLVQVGAKGLMSLPWFSAEPLLKEMMECVQIVPDYPKFNTPRALMDDPSAPGGGDLDIEEIPTRAMLRGEIFKLHADFLEAALPSLLEKVKTAIAAGKLSDIATGSQK